MFLSAHPDATPDQVLKGMTDAATKDKVVDPGEGSHNLLLHTT
ncbi:hypothetical protein A4R44_05729 [Amycolatopsis sp. M39]|nr:hypothetical protein A4R44_05729 [Amycolatopsis sp. M39]